MIRVLIYVSTLKQQVDFYYQLMPIELITALMRFINLVIVIAVKLERLSTVRMGLKSAGRKYKLCKN